MFNDELSFLSNNVNGVEASEKRLKLFEYFRNLRKTLLIRCRRNMERGF